MFSDPLGLFGSGNEAGVNFSNMQRGFCVGQKIGGKTLQKNYCNIFKCNTKTSIM